EGTGGPAAEENGAGSVRAGGRRGWRAAKRRPAHDGVAAGAGIRGAGAGLRTRNARRAEIHAVPGERMGTQSRGGARGRSARGGRLPKSAGAARVQRGNVTGKKSDHA